MAKRPAALKSDSLNWYDEAIKELRRNPKVYKLEDYDPLDRDEILLFGSPPPSADDIWIDEMFTEMMARGNPFAAIFEPHPKKPLIWDLYRLDEAERLKAIREPPYRDLRVAELLLGESSRSQPRSLSKALDMAQLAEAIAFYPDPNEKKRAERVRARACCWQANVHRLRREWRKCEQRLNEAWGHFAGWSSDSVERTPLLQTLSALREDQGRFGEALDLLGQAVTLEESPAGWGAGGLRLRQSVLHLKRNDPGRAMTLLSTLAQRMARNEECTIYQIEVDLGRAACLAALDLRRPARRLLEDGRFHRGSSPRTPQRLTREWFDCRIALRLGDTAHAIPRLEALERRLFRDDDPCAACLCWLDLRQAYAQAGRSAKNFRRLDELLDDQQRNLDFLSRPRRAGGLEIPGFRVSQGIPFEWWVEGLVEIRSKSDRTEGEWAALRQRLGRLVPSPLHLH